METISITEARKKLASLCKKLRDEAEPEAIALTKNGKPEIALLTWDFFEALSETVEVLCNKELTKELRKALKQVKERKTHSLEKVKTELA